MTILPLLLFLSAPPQIFEPTGQFAVPSTSAADVARRSQPQTSGGEQPAAVEVRPPERYLAMFTASWCGPCQSWKRNVLPQVKAAGYRVEMVEMTNDANLRKYSRKIRRYPSFVVIDYKTGEWLSDVKVGSIGLTTAVGMLGGTVEKTVTRTKTYRPAVTVAGKALVEREEVIRHLLTGDVHRGKFTREQLDAMTDLQIIDMHNREHGVRTVNGVKQ